MGCCAKPNVIETEGSIVCTNCATVLGRSFVSIGQNQLQKKERIQNEIFDPNFRDTFKIEKCKDKVLYRRLFKINRSSFNNERTNKTIRILLESLCDGNNTLLETSYNIYRRSYSKGLTRGRDQEYIAKLCFYLAKRTMEFISIKHFEKKYNTKIIFDDFYRFRQCVNSLGYKFKDRDLENLIIKFCDNLKVNSLDALRLYKKAPCNNNSGKDPCGFIAAYIYLSSNMTQSQICRVIGITEVTLRSRINDIKTKASLQEKQKM